MYRARASSPRASISVRALSPAAGAQVLGDQNYGSLGPSQPLGSQRQRREIRVRFDIDDGRRWTPRSALLLGGGVSLVIWALLLWGLFAVL
jgi:hypothetical protein